MDKLIKEGLYYELFGIMANKRERNFHLEKDQSLSIFIIFNVILNPRNRKNFEKFNFSQFLPIKFKATLTQGSQTIFLQHPNLS